MLQRNAAQSQSKMSEGGGSSFLWGLALWINEGIETGRWGNGSEEGEYSPDSENLLLSEKMKDYSDRERVDQVHPLV